jgi:hypothetical protein
LEYHKSKAQYTATIKREKLRSWKKYCNMTGANPWNEIYKLAVGKRRQHLLFTSLQKPDESLTTDMDETVTLMLEHFMPEDNAQDDSEFHKQVRAQSQGAVNTSDDREFTLAEIRNVVESMNSKKAPGEDGITGEIFKQAF